MLQGNSTDTPAEAAAEGKSVEPAKAGEKK
jgi:hypothetical protein